MTDEDQVRRALTYEIEPWTPDPDALMRGGRRKALARRGAAAGAAIAVAVTMTGVALAVGVTGGTGAGQPPVAGVPAERGPTASPTAPFTPAPGKSYECVARNLWTTPGQRQTPGQRRVSPPQSVPTTWLCNGQPYTRLPVKTIVCYRNGVRTTPVPSFTVRGEPCERVVVVSRPTTPVPTSVPAGE